MKNKAIAAVLSTLADYMELNGENPFKVNAYRKAARTVESSRVALADHRDQLEQLSGIGKGSAGVIEEIMATGSTTLLTELKEKLPSGLPDMLVIPGLGPKSIYTLYQKLEVTSIAELKQAAEEKRIQALSGFGPKKEQKILEGIAQFKNRPNRRLLNEAMTVAEAMRAELESNQQITAVQLAGSLRRSKETIKDIDFVTATTSPQAIADWITTLPLVVEVVNHGDTKVSVVVSVNGIEMGVDIRLVRPEQFASALHHFTGSKEHNVRIRQRAKSMGYKVSEYGIDGEDQAEMKTFGSEEAFFKMLDLPYIPPELREDRGEIEAAEKKKLPHLIEQAEIRGDIHMHTVYSDGNDSVMDMARAALAKGYEYIAITDHSRSLRVASGLSIDELKEQWEEIDRVNEALEGITVLKGTEMDILPDGSLDFPDEILKELDVVIASIHSGFKQDEETMTKRIIEAIQNPYVHIFAHPTGRLVLKRDPYHVNVEKLFEAAQSTGTILELNANPRRLDLNDEALKRAKEEYGLKFTINTDAHITDGLAYMRYGIATARRGWLQKEDVINTYTLTQLRKVLKQKQK
ncbi:DNA polymerase/3'-5' exonuclease PolX [Hazenella sp. IB182357]|uniref:DNA polymerase beta n=1 Tax=Polycladospora coralii TaxID=2771432 RepID=A0A926NCF6_9BACL|nr:DNA polymerase/3'-5' exonuclease PolX [Polycladospora coralii]MBD1372830.1 DNA polymerase/3'-5' exonuclease PolX [Polycladospora coralii]